MIGLLERIETSMPDFRSQLVSDFSDLDDSVSSQSSLFVPVLRSLRSLPLNFTKHDEIHGSFSALPVSVARGDNFWHSTSAKDVGWTKVLWSGFAR